METLLLLLLLGQSLGLLGGADKDQGDKRCCIKMEDIPQSTPPPSPTQPPPLCFYGNWHNSLQFQRWQRGGR